MIFSSMNPSGERLDNLSGVAALLRYPLPGVDDIEEEDIEIDDDFTEEELEEIRNKFNESI
jgi:protein pelota